MKTPVFAAVVFFTMIAAIIAFLCFVNVFYISIGVAVIFTLAAIETEAKREEMYVAGIVLSAQMMALGTPVYLFFLLPIAVVAVLSVTHWVMWGASRAHQIHIW